MKPSAFKKSTTFFHLNVPFKTTGYFKSLDWSYLQRSLYKCAVLYNVELQALVMMDTHFHLLIGVADNNENFFCDEIGIKLSNESDHSVYCEPVTNLAQYLNSYKYIYNNPVQAGICERADQYPYSSIQILMGKCSSHCLISDKMRFIQNPRRVLHWLNSDARFKDSELKIFAPC